MSLDPRVPLVLAASAVWETAAPVNVHQIARRFAARGHPVLFVESTGLRPPALSAPHDLKRVAARVRHFASGVRPGGDGVQVLAPLALPGAGSAALRRASEVALALQVERAVRRLGFEAPVVWAFLPTAVSWASRLRSRALVYHCVDDYAGNPGVDRAWIRSLEARMVERADLVIASSEVLGARLREQRKDVQVAPNVADVSLFARAVDEELTEPPVLATLPRPRALYVGNLAGYRIDAALLDAARRAVGEGSLVLVGETGLGDTAGAPAELARLLAADRVTLAGPRPHAELPAWMRHCDVALVPFLDNEHTRGSLPLKLFEYLAAGLPVVARSLPNLVGLEALGVQTAHDAEGFGRAVGAALAEPAEARIARSRAARLHGWEQRIEELADWIGAVVSRGPVPEVR